MDDVDVNQEKDAAEREDGMLRIKPWRPVFVERKQWAMRDPYADRSWEKAEEHYRAMWTLLKGPPPALKDWLISPM